MQEPIKTTTLILSILFVLAISLLSFRLGYEYKASSESSVSALKRYLAAQAIYQEVESVKVQATIRYYTNVEPPHDLFITVHKEKE